MKKVFLNLSFYLIAIFSFSSVQAQDIATPSAASTGKGFMIGITGGLSAPTGNYTKTDYDNPQSGFAGSGYNIGVMGTWFVHKNFGISALVSYHQYAYKGLQQMVNGYQDGFDVDSASVTSKGTNHTLNILVGPYYSLPITDRLSVDFRVLIGLVNASMAGNDVWLEDSDKLFNFSQSTSTATTFGFQGGAGLRYDFSKHFGLMVNADYFYSKPNFSITNVNRNNNAGREITTYNEPITGLNANLTLVYSLRK